jgi:hypothetical protein
LTAKTGAEQSVSLEPIDGAEPLAGVLIDPVSGDLYGTASTDFNWGGPGEVYRVANGKLSVVWGFGGYDGDGADPEGALIVDHGALYGTTAQGGNVTSSCEFGCGTVFEITK